MQLSISNIAWNVDQDVAVADLLERHGVKAIDVAPTKYFPNIAVAMPNEVAKVRDFWNRRGIEIIGGQSLFFGRPDLNIFGSKDVRDESLQHLKRFAQVSEGLGIRKLVFGSPKNRRRGALGSFPARSLAVDFFGRLGEIGAQYGIVFCLEPNPEEYGCDFMVTDDEAFEIVALVGHSHIALQLDTGAAFMNHDDIPRLVSAHGSAYGHIHLSAPGLKPLHLDPAGFDVLPAYLQENLGALEHMTIEMLTTKPEVALAEIESSLRMLNGGLVSA